MVLVRGYNYWHSDPVGRLAHKEAESTREHLSMQCSMIKAPRRCSGARTHAGKTWPGKHCVFVEQQVKK